MMDLNQTNSPSFDHACLIRNYGNHTMQEKDIKIE